MSGAGGPPASAGAGPRRHLVETSLGTVHVRTLWPAGAAAGLPLVLLHMSPQSSAQFASVAPLLARDRLVVMPDRVGFGDSDPLPARPFGLDEVARATVEAVDGVGVGGAFDLFGIHTGSSEAIEIAARTAPARVRRAAIVALPAFSAEEVERFRGLFKPPPPPGDDGRLLRWLWRFSSGPFTPRLDAPGWGPEQVHALVLQHLRAWPAAWRMFHCVFDHPTADRAAEVRQPLLVLAPADELREITLRSFPRLGPGARLLELPHMDFEVLTLHAAEITAALRAFLDERERP